MIKQLNNCTVRLSQENGVVTMSIEYGKINISVDALENTPIAAAFDFFGRATANGDPVTPPLESNVNAVFR